MEMPTLCTECGEIKDFADFRDDPNGFGQMICESCYYEKDEEILDWRGIPKCCLDCGNFENDWDEYSGRSSYYCRLNIFLPTKKGECSKQS